MENDQDKFQELTRLNDLIEADLLAAFLENGDVTFKVIRTSQTMASIVPRTQNPIIFQVLEEHLPRAQELLEEYREKQASDSE
jgi:hypothetical protein